MSIQIPSELICPISQTLMKDPITLGCGHTFDREGLDSWARANSTCPTCRINFSNESLVTNWTLKSLIENLNSPMQNFSLDSQASTDQILVELKSNPTELVSNVNGLVCLNSSDINLCLEVKDSDTRRPVFFVCVIDISGSMGSIVGNGEGGKAFTRLDLVKHVLNVIIASLNESDCLSLITYSDNSELLLEPSKMNEENKQKAKNCLRVLEPTNCTYTYQGIQLAYGVIKNSPESYLKSIILLTDGQDSEGNEILQAKFDRLQKPSQVQMNTFGFSNDIDSGILEKLANKAGGIFGFIPDQSMIGTIFLNFLANTFRTFAIDLKIELNDGFEFKNTKEKVNKGILQFGRSFNYFIEKKDQNLSAKDLKVRIGFSDEEMFDLNLEFKENFDFTIQKARHKMLELLQDPDVPKVKLDKYEKSIELASVKEFLAELKNPKIKDINNEQIALSLKNWNTWGAHYLRSFRYAHLLEQAINFKSPSMVFYRTPKFDEILSKLTDVFCTLPPPKPSGIAFDQNAQKVNMRNIMNRNAGCILSSCLVKMNSGEFKQIKDLKKGDILQGGSKVVCLIKSNYSGPLIKVNNLYITPYHPIFYNNKWIFPAELINSDINQEEDIRNPFINLIQQDNKTWSVCNLVLDRKHFVNVEGIRCITLGHGYEENSVLRHSYYGTNKCIQDLEKLNGWNEGYVSLANFKIRRDQDGLVSGTYDYEY